MERKPHLSIDDSPENSSVHDQDEKDNIEGDNDLADEDEEAEDRVPIYDWEDPDDVENREARRREKERKELAE